MISFLTIQDFNKTGYMSRSFFPNFIGKQIKRSTQIAKTANTLIGGFRTASRIGILNTDEPDREILPKYIQIFCRKMLGSFDVKVVQIEPVPQTHGLWVSNHISWMDIPVVGSVSPVFFLAKSEIANWLVMGKLAKAAGTLFIQRGSGDSGSVSEQISHFLNSGSSVVFFPEATTTNGHKIKRIHGKLLQAAIDTGKPIQPIVICYVNEQGLISNELAYCGNLSMKDSFKQVLDSKNITAYVLPLEAIYPEDRNIQELTDILQQKLQDGLTCLQKSVLKEKPEEALW